MKGSLIFFLISLVAISLLGACEGGELVKDFYAETCPGAEDIVRSIIWENVARNSTLPAKFLRMEFHDCFVMGCDGSILIDSTPGNPSEKEATPNLSLGGFDVLDQVKSALEEKCPGVVSCADIVALAARDSVSFQYQMPLWEVLTGRRDGSISQKSEALAQIPQPTFNFSSLQQSFASKGLGVHDLVVLSGGHTIGVGHCNFFSNRLYNFTGNGDQDPSLNPMYAEFLKSQCRSLSDNTTFVFMDPESGLTFDNHYYQNLKEKEGMFQSDAALLTDGGASNIVDLLLNPDTFFIEFGKSMINMGAVQVLTGTSGEIRKNCRVPNY